MHREREKKLHLVLPLLRERENFILIISVAIVSVYFQRKIEIPLPKLLVTLSNGEGVVKLMGEIFLLKK